MSDDTDETPDELRVAVSLRQDENGNIGVADVECSGGLRLSEAQFWLEEGILHLRRTLGH